MHDATCICKRRPEVLEIPRTNGWDVKCPWSRATVFCSNLTYKMNQEYFVWLFECCWPVGIIQVSIDHLYFIHWHLVNLVHWNTVFKNSSNFDNLADLWQGIIMARTMVAWSLETCDTTGSLDVCQWPKDGSFLALNQAKLLPNLAIFNLRSLWMRLGLKI